jgi:hypothetical protein
VRLRIFDSRPVWSRVREAEMRPHDKSGSIWNNREQRNSGARVSKVEVTRQYKLASSCASCVHGSLVRARNRGDGRKLGGAPTLAMGIILRAAAPGIDSPPILDDNGL